MRFVNTLPLLFGLSGLFATAPVWALPTDREQPIRVQADSAELDDAKHVAVYRGDVVVTQGTLKITGDTVTVTQDKNGEIETLTSVGRPAYYEQKPSPDKPLVKAYGLTIQYFAANERIVLIDQAKVIQDGNTFEGEKIVYDTQRQIVNAGRATGSKVTAPRARIDMMLQPRGKKGPAEQSAQ
jgi:lipopolysaccharide export system protein LptA